MIRVHYKYWRRSSNEWISTTKVFDDCVKAKKFMWSLRYRNAYVFGYDCDNMEDNDYLNMSVSLYQINY